MADAAANDPRPINRPAITLCVILAVIMQALDTTIANVALPYMQGSVSASADQINWVLTSYIVAAAIMTPPSGFLANRFGRKRVLMVAVVGFVVASVLCGIAQSLVQIVAFRLLQGFFGAALVPLGAVHSARHLYGGRTRVGHGPVRRIGDGRAGAGAGDRRLADRPLQLAMGILYQRAVRRARIRRHIVLPAGRRKTSAAAKLDWLGFGSLSIAIAAMQVFLDRGAQLDWFSSFEILIEAVVCASALYIFLVHTFTAKNSFVNPRLFLDRNFSVGMLFIFIVGITYLASLALLTPYLQTLMGYPVVTAGIVMGPRGLGTMACMFLVGRLIGRIDTRLLLLTGLLLTAWAMYDMTGWNPNVSQWTIAVTGFIQGAGLGFLFVPLTTVTFATLAPEQRADGTGLLQPLTQRRIQRRHIGRLLSADQKQSGQSRDHREPCHGIQSRIRQQHRAACLESLDRGRTRGARSGHTNAGFDHQLHRRFQVDDDPFACRHSARPAAAERPSVCAKTTMRW